MIERFGRVLATMLVDLIVEKSDGFLEILACGEIQKKCS